MSDKIEPALTAEEWANSHVERHRSEGLDDYYRPLPVARIDKDGLHLHYRGSAGVTLSEPESRHAAAALALHGQPFGFTREDLELVLLARDAGRVTVDDGYPVYVGRPLTFGEQNRLRDVAAKIEALLPPEKP